MTTEHGPRPQIDTLDESQLDVVYGNAEAAIYAIAEEDSAQGLTDRILSPVYQAAMEASEGYQPGLLLGEARVVQMAAAVMHRLQDNQELVAEDSIEQVPVNGAGWDIVRYTDSEGNSFVIDPFNDYVGPEDDSPTRYDQVTLLHGGFSVEHEAVYIPEITSGSAEWALKGQDRIINDPENGTFAVFDGMGGHKGGDVAAQLAKDTFVNAGIHDIATDGPESVLAEISEYMHMASSTIIAQERMDPELHRMGTTAVFAQVVKHEGKNYLVWGSVGDSRLYVSDESGVNQISTDDGLFDDEGRPIPGQGNKVTNAIGGMYNGSINQHNQGILELSEGARVMLCSDGITGDESIDELPEFEVHSILRNSASPQAAADELLRVSKKIDDKSVIVFDVAA